jgi:hypothetical protein
MKLSTNAKTMKALRDDIVSYIELRAELQRAAEKSVLGKNIRRVYLQSLADDVRFLEVDDYNGPG